MSSIFHVMYQLTLSLVISKETHIKVDLSIMKSMGYTVTMQTKQDVLVNF